MKSRMIGFISVFAVLAVLFVLTDGTGTVQPAVQSQSIAPSTTDADFKGLKIQ